MRAVLNEKELEENVRSAQTILIVTHKNPNPDSLGASLALYLALSQDGKRVTVACPDTPTVEFGNLFGIDRVANELVSKNFVISLDYKEGSIEKVSYNIEGNKFNLVIQPKGSSQPFNENMVHFSRSGADADIIIIVGCQTLDDLSKLYTQEQEMYSKIPIINIDTNPNNTLFGKINIIDSTASSNSEIVAGLLKTLNIAIDQDCASNILTGIIWATDRFIKGNIRPETLETSGMCLRMGAKLPGWKYTKSEEQTPFTVTNMVGTIQRDEKSKKTKTPPPDWLEPKIFKGTTLS